MLFNELSDTVRTLGNIPVSYLLPKNVNDVQALTLTTLGNNELVPADEPNVGNTYILSTDKDAPVLTVTTKDNKDLNFDLALVQNLNKKGATIAFDYGDYRYMTKCSDNQELTKLYDSLVAIVGSAEKGHQKTKRENKVYSQYKWIR